ncbi:hypothetical protein IMCC9480_245 [Oxalobacteraceae bacterium IMCC9480]|nr:hypothetical protein IMCC9480_245 [Oxalobacteraceae bacterium IMCC9480]
MLDSLKVWAKGLKRDVITLMFASRDPATPLLPKLLAITTVAYALSPIDLIPDFIPVIGYLDDLIIVPVGIWLCLRLIPESVIVNSRAKAEAWLADNPVKPRSMVGLAVIFGIWLGCTWLLWRWYANGAA